MLVTLKNNGAGQVYLSTANKTIANGESFTFSRAAADLDRDESFKEFIKKNPKIGVSYVAEPHDFVAPGLTAIPVAYAAGVRPDPNSCPVGSVIWNATTKEPNWASDRSGGIWVALSEQIATAVADLTVLINEGDAAVTAHVDSEIARVEAMIIAPQDTAFGVTVSAGAARMREAVSGSMVLKLGGSATPAPQSISVTELNTALYGQGVRVLEATLESASGEIHSWANLTPVLSSVYIPVPLGAAGGAAATFGPGTPVFTGGRLFFVVTFATGGVDPVLVYEVGDTVTAKVQVSAADALLGWPVAPVTLTYNVVA